MKEANRKLSFVWSLIIGGFIGASLGTALLGSWGPAIGGFAIIPALLGAILLVLIVSFIFRAIKKKK